MIGVGILAFNNWGIYVNDTINVTNPEEPGYIDVYEGHGLGVDIGYIRH
jgi:hypothetical protein